VTYNQYVIDIVELPRGLGMLSANIRDVVQEDEGRKMKEHDDRPRKVSTCFEGWPGAEMLQKILGQGGIGSLCEEILRSFGTKPGGGPEGPREDKRPARGEKTDQEPQAAPSRNKVQNSGGVK
jgi:hypothetical protein